SSSRRPLRPSDRSRRAGGRRRRSSTAATIEGRRLLARTPFLLVGRDDCREDVLVGPALASAVILRLALLDADLADEGHALKLLEADRASGTRLWAHVIGLEPERAVENGPQLATADLDRLGLARRGAFQEQMLEDFAPLVRPISEGDFADEHFSIA